MQRPAAFWFIILGLLCCLIISCSTNASGSSSSPDRYTLNQLSPEIRKAYLTLVEKVAVPVDPVKLAQSGLTGLVDALGLQGSDRNDALAVQFGNDKEGNARILTESYDTLFRKYGTGKSPDLVLQAMFHNLAMAVGDEHTYYLSPDLAAINAREESGQDNFYGIGVAVRRRDTGGPVIIEVFPGGPAGKSGLKPGDVLLKVGDQDITHGDVNFTNLIRGPEGTTVTLTVQRAGAPQPLQFTVTRGKIEQQILASKTLTSTIGYIRVYEFVRDPQVPLINRVTGALQELDQQGMKSLVLDMRNNPGGDVEQMELIASLFIPNPDGNRAVGIFHYASGEESPIRMTGKLWPHQYRIIVLVNEASGSGAEILPMAMHDYKVATLIGQKTAGAVGSTTKITFIDKSELWYTESVIYSAVTHTTPNQKGIEPDIVVPDPTTDDIIAGRDPQIDAAVTFLKGRQ